MSQELTIRKATEADTELLSSLIQKSFYDVAVRFALTKQNCPKHPSNCTPDWIASDLLRGVRYFIANLENIAFGCVGLEAPNASGRYLERLAVLPEYRRRGFGRSLVEHVVKEARRDRALSIGIGIIADQHELKAWYERQGFRETETRTFPHLPFRVTLMNLRLLEV